MMCILLVKAVFFMMFLKGNEMFKKCSQNLSVLLDMQEHNDVEVSPVLGLYRWSVFYWDPLMHSGVLVVIFFIKQDQNRIQSGIKLSYLERKQMHCCLKSGVTRFACLPTQECGPPQRIPLNWSDLH